MSTAEHATESTRMRRAVELIKQVQDHPNKDEILRLAAEQLQDQLSQTRK